MTIKNFYDLDAWQRGNSFVLRIYNITKSFPKEELFGLVGQLKRAASSITANIAEGFERYHFKDKARFYYQARGSVAEAQNFLLLARSLHYIKEEECNTLLKEADDLRKLINGLIRSIEKQK